MENHISAGRITFPFLSDGHIFFLLQIFWRWVRRRGSTEWPPRNPDMALDFFPVGYLEKKSMPLIVKQQQSWDCQTTAELGRRIREAGEKIDDRLLST